MTGHTGITRRLLELDRMQFLAKYLRLTEAIRYRALYAERGREPLGPLALAVQYGHEDIVDLLLSSPKDEFDINYRDEYGYTPLHYAAENGHLQIVTDLLSRPWIRPDIRALRGRGETPLSVAIRREDAAMVEVLLQPENNVEINSRCVLDDSRTPLHQAALKGNVEILNAIIARGADPQILDNDGKTPRDLSKEHGHPEIVKILDSLNINGG